MKKEETLAFLLVVGVLCTVTILTYIPVQSTTTVPSINRSVRATLDPYFTAMNITVVSSELSLGNFPHTEFMTGWDWENAFNASTNNAVQTFVVVMLNDNITMIFAWQEYVHLNAVEGMEDRTGFLVEQIKYAFLSNSVHYALIVRSPGGEALYEPYDHS